MELRQLEHVVAVAEEGRFTGAATRCHLAQSAISASVRSLERELGASLFVRTTRRVELTEAGRVFLREARQVLAAARAARTAVADLGTLGEGRLRLGAVVSTGMWFDLPALVAAFTRRHPRVDVVARTGEADVLLSGIDRRQLDAVVCTLEPILSSGLEALALTDAPFVVAFHPGHRLARRRQVGLEAVAGEPFIDLPTSSVLRRILDRMFEESGCRRETRFEVGDVMTALGFVAHGQGICCLPLPHIPPPTGRVTFVPLRAAGTPGQAWRLALVTSSSDRREPPAEALLELARAGIGTFPTANDPEGSVADPTARGRRPPS